VTSKITLKLCLFLIFSSINSFGQDINAVDSVLKNIKEFNFKKGKQNLLKITDNDYKVGLSTLIQITENRGQNFLEDSLALSNLKLRSNVKEFEILKNLSKGFYTLHNFKENFEGLQYFDRAYILSKEVNNKDYLRISLIGIIELYNVQILHNTESFQFYINELENIAETDIDNAIVNFYKNSFNANSIYSPDEFFITSKKLIKIINKIHLSSELSGRFYEDIAVYYRVLKNVDSAYYYNNKILILENTIYNNKSKFNAHLELAAVEAANKNSLKSKSHIYNAKKYLNKSDSAKSIYSLEKFKALYIHEALKEYDSAYFLLEKAMIYEADSDFKNNKSKIAKLNIQLRTSEKEKQNLILQSEIEKEQSQQRNLWIGGIISLLFISITGFLLFKNTKRKQRIAEQEHEIEIQKTEKLLKDQELTTIDAMIEGQEKERQRLASDLHDSVGATLSAARLQFEHLQKHKGSLQNEEELFSKTGELLEEAYQEVRSMAHVKNNGVIAKNGLLPAIEKLAKSASITNQLKIEVQDFGLTERIDNSLEITIFRIIQELVTNIIKHADATEANISLTQLEDTINIIVEDNGKGFNTRKIIHTENGMGLSSIEKRVEHLEGSMEVDSTPGKGTNILIDIPI